MEWHAGPAQFSSLDRARAALRPRAGATRMEHQLRMRSPAAAGAMALGCGARCGDGGYCAEPALKAAPEAPVR